MASVDQNDTVDKDTLKSYFQNGDKPTEQQFSALIDNLLHIDEAKNIELEKAGIPEAEVGNVNNKYMTPMLTKKAINTLVRLVNIKELRLEVEDKIKALENKIDDDFKALMKNDDADKVIDTIQEVYDFVDQLEESPGGLKTLLDGKASVNHTHPEIETTNLGHNGDLPTIYFTKNDWKDRPLGFRGFVSPSESIGLPGWNWFYVERIGNRNEQDGYAWNAYPYNSRKIYFGRNAAPGTENNGLPIWSEIPTYNISETGFFPIVEVGEVIFEDVPTEGKYKKIIHKQGTDKIKIFAITRTNVTTENNSKEESSEDPNNHYAIIHNITKDYFYLMIMEAKNTELKRVTVDYMIVKAI